jgi:hypothetical protein
VTTLPKRLSTRRRTSTIKAGWFSKKFAELRIKNSESSKPEDTCDARTRGGSRLTLNEVQLAEEVEYSVKQTIPTHSYSVAEALHNDGSKAVLASSKLN